MPALGEAKGRRAELLSVGEKRRDIVTREDAF